MAQCVVADPTTGALSTSASDPCVSYLLMSPAEFNAINASPLNLSAADGALLSAAILGVWGMAYGFRALVKALDTDGEPGEA